MSIDDCYQNLANAIVIKAADDYRKAKQIYLDDAFDFVAQHQIQSIKKFFRSDWFGDLTMIDPEHLIYMLDKEVKNDHSG